MSSDIWESDGLQTDLKWWEKVNPLANRATLGARTPDILGSFCSQRCSFTLTNLLNLSSFVLAGSVPPSSTSPLSAAFTCGILAKNNRKLGQKRVNIETTVCEFWENSEIIDVHESDDDESSLRKRLGDILHNPTFRRCHGQEPLRHL